MVELEIPESLLGVPLPADCVGVDELVAWSEIKTMLVTVWPPWFVVKKTEVAWISEVCGVVVAARVFVDGALVGVNEELCSVVDATGDEEVCGGADDAGALLDEVGGGVDDDGGSVELDGVGELFAGTVTVTPWRGAKMFIAGESSSRS